MRRSPTRSRQSLTATWTCVGAGGGTCTAAGVGQHQRHGQPARRRIGHLHGVGHARRRRRRARWSTPPPSPLRAVSPTRPRPTTRRPTPTRSSGRPICRSPRPTASPRVTAGGSVTYTIAASNAGPSNATGATVADTFPAALTATWTCVGAGGGTCTAAGSGNINDTVNLPAGGSVTYTVTADARRRRRPAPWSTPPPSPHRAVSPTRTRPTTRRPTPTRSTPLRRHRPRPRRPRRRTTTDHHDHHHDHRRPTTTTTTTSSTTSTSTTTTLPGQVETVTALTSSPNPSTARRGGDVHRHRDARRRRRAGRLPQPRRPHQVPGPDGGTLTISDGDIVLAVVPLEAGRAAFTTSSLTAGTHTITAAFSGTATAAPSSATDRPTGRRTGRPASNPLNPCAYSADPATIVVASPATSARHGDSDGAGRKPPRVGHLGATELAIGPTSASAARHLGASSYSAEIGDKRRSRVAPRDEHGRRARTTPSFGVTGRPDLVAFLFLGAVLVAVSWRL